MDSFFFFYNIIINVEMWKMVEGGPIMWIIIEFYNIIIKSANMDKEGGGPKIAKDCQRSSKITEDH